MSAIPATRGEKTQELWVPVKWVAPDHVEPDVPLDKEGLPAIPVRVDMPLEMSPRPGHPAGPLVETCRIWVAKEDVSLVPAAREPSDRDRAMVMATFDAVQRTHADGEFANRERAIAAFRQISQSLATTGEAKKEILRRALLEAARRGLRQKDANDISSEHQLSASAG